MQSKHTLTKAHGHPNAWIHANCTQPKPRLQASELSYAHQLAIANTGLPSLSAVLIVPAHFGPHQRQAMRDAAELAKLDVLSLSHSHASAALQYGIERTFTKKVDQQILLDIASTDAIAALVEYSTYNVTRSPKSVSQFAVKDIAWREGGGAGQLDSLLMRHFASEFEAKTGHTDVLQHGKVAAKLRKAVRRTKEMLTPNAEAPLHVEELHKGIDFSSKVTRTQLEDLAGV
jgi:hypoxia up-regulated 1